jgi:hypothetical protein
MGRNVNLNWQFLLSVVEPDRFLNVPFNAMHCFVAASAKSYQFGFDIIALLAS